jgi:hypothetical protein
MIKNKKEPEKESAIDFYGQVMKLSEAKNYLGRLKAGKVTIKLDEKEKMRCRDFLEVMKRTDIKEGKRICINDIRI